MPEAEMFAAFGASDDYSISENTILMAVLYFILIASHVTMTMFHTDNNN